jgi:predicted ATPase
VGFGISQLLPVIVQCFYARPGSILILEQPEIHLHPRVQASLADLFVEAIHAREDGRDRRLQLLVESHSEHFLRRLQRRIAEEKLSPEEVAIYFCEPGSNGSTLRELDVDPYGNIRNWPDHFFGDEIGDLAAMAEASIERQAAEASDS